MNNGLNVLPRPSNPGIGVSTGSATGKSAPSVVITGVATGRARPPARELGIGFGAGTAGPWRPAGAPCRLGGTDGAPALLGGTAATPGLGGGAGGPPPNRDGCGAAAGTAGCDGKCVPKWEPPDRDAPWWLLAIRGPDAYDCSASTSSSTPGYRASGDFCISRSTTAASPSGACGAASRSGVGCLNWWAIIFST